ncbi:dihydrofolate reductase [Rubricella aquisinus]|uniref:Dihydrofolate reductase n=1 Tax=Rubricella aquisinus TaxID=2028108 RepID=A0A840WT58_9RHOB|nr:dihydrofolate reductase family protein [Rubricella aquisinus]MBB5514380.1 dihydrofolate reductase [Rubricella aquisinus]
MRPVIYDVAVTLDGFIAAPDGDFSMFPGEGPHLQPYFDRLMTYDAVVMGAATYRVGLDAGLAHGARAYPHMHHVVFSQTLPDVPDGAIELCRSDPATRVAALKAEAGGAIYLCGGGQLASALLHAGLIDRVRIKRAPIVLGHGIPLFTTGRAEMTLVTCEPYANGVVYLDYEVNRG